MSPLIFLLYTSIMVTQQMFFNSTLYGRGRNTVRSTWHFCGRWFPMPWKPKRGRLPSCLYGDNHIFLYISVYYRRENILCCIVLQLKARYGGTYVFTMTTSSDHEQEVEQLVHRLSPSASRIYHISGTQKFELPKQEVKIADVFYAVESAKHRFSIYAWGLVDTTSEDVFIKVAKGAQAFNVAA
jgi:hypothetical protein